jgi:hypothetical protein
MLNGRIVFALLCLVTLMGCGISPPFTHKPPTTNTADSVLKANHRMLSDGATQIDRQSDFMLTYMVHTGLPPEKANQFAPYASTPEVKAELVKTVESTDFIENVGEAADIFSNVTVGMSDVSLGNALLAGLSVGVAVLAGQEQFDIRKHTFFAQGTYVTDDDYEGLSESEATRKFNTQFRIKALAVAESLGYSVECIQYCERTTDWSSFMLKHREVSQDYYTDATGELIPSHIWLRLTYGELETADPSEFAALGKKFYFKAKGVKDYDVILNYVTPKSDGSVSWDRSWQEGGMDKARRNFTLLGFSTGQRFFTQLSESLHGWFKMNLLPYEQMIYFDGRAYKMNFNWENNSFIKGDVTHVVKERVLSVDDADVSTAAE